MMNKKNGFTLAEILMVMILVGIILALSSSVFSHMQHNYKHIYWATYKTLKRCAGELLAESKTKNIDEAKTDGNGNVMTFCQKLAAQFNIANTGEICKNTYSLGLSGPLSDSSITPDKPSFTLTNGTRFYVGNAFNPVGASNYLDSDAVVIAVDLNGKSKPNIMDSRSYTGGKAPDIVAFAMTKTGNVVPITPYADDQTYITAHVQVCSYANGCPRNLDTSGDGNSNTAYESSLIAKHVSLRKALALSDSFPHKPGATNAELQYHNDSSRLFKVGHSTDARCLSTNTNTYCRVHIINLLIDTM